MPEMRKALLLIDLQNDFVDQAGKLFVPNTVEFLHKLPILISEFRTKGDVFFIKTEYAGPRSISSNVRGGYSLILKADVASQQPSVLPAEASMTVGGRLTSDVEAFLTPPYNNRASWSQCCRPGSSGSFLPDVLSSSVDRSMDMQIVKSSYSPFYEASFLSHLRKQLITKLYICGSLSNISVYATVIDAVFHGLSVTIVEDCVGYRDEQCHYKAMYQMASQMGASRTSYQELMDDFARDGDLNTQYKVASQHASPSRTLAPGPSPGPWELACATDSRANIEGIVEGKSVYAILDTRQLFGYTLIVFDCGLMPFDCFQQYFLAAGVQLVQGDDMMAALKGGDGEDRSEAEVLHGIFQTGTGVRSDGPEQASHAYQSLLETCEFFRSSQDYTYFCIYENCSVVFHEQKNWERHDIQSHDAQQYWICQQEASSHIEGQSATCDNISHDRTLFETHLRQHHEVSSEDLIVEYIARDCVNNGHQPHFFCGFCTSPVQYNKEKGKKGWRERFNHLAQHMERRDKLYRSGYEYIENQDGEREAAASMDPKYAGDIISARPLAHSTKTSTKTTAYFPDTSNDLTVTVKATSPTETVFTDIDVDQEGNQLPSTEYKPQEPRDNAVYVCGRLLCDLSFSRGIVTEVVVHSWPTYHIVDKKARDIITQASRGLSIRTSSSYFEGVPGLVELSCILQYGFEQRMFPSQQDEELLHQMQGEVVDFQQQRLAAFAAKENVLRDDIDVRCLFIAEALSSLQKYPAEVMINELGDIDVFGNPQTSESFLFHADTKKLYIDFSRWLGPGAKTEILWSQFSTCCDAGFHFLPQHVKKYPVQGMFIRGPPKRLLGENADDAGLNTSKLAATPTPDLESVSAVDRETNSCDWVKVEKSEGCQ